jgi:hypothetical protein
MIERALLEILAHPDAGFRAAAGHGMRLSGSIINTRFYP